MKYDRSLIATSLGGGEGTGFFALPETHLTCLKCLAGTLRAAKHGVMLNIFLIQMHNLVEAKLALKKAKLFYTAASTKAEIALVPTDQRGP